MIGNRIGLCRSFVTIGLLSACVTMAGTAFAAPAKKQETLTHRLNIAEQQKMLGERLTRTWAMKALGTLRARATNQFDEDSRRYSRQLKFLQTEADTPELKENYALLEQLWGKYIELTEAGASQENVKAIADQNEELVWIAEKGANMLRQRIGAEQSEGLRVAGQARALSQRMAKLYFFRSLGATAPFIASDMKKAESDYLVSIKRLRELSEDRPKSASVIALVDQQWMFFSEVIRRPASREDRDQVYQTLAKSSDSLLSALEDLSQSFEQ